MNVDAPPSFVFTLGSWMLAFIHSCSFLRFQVAEMMFEIFGHVPASEDGLTPMYLDAVGYHNMAASVYDLDSVLMFDYGANKVCEHNFVRATVVF